MAIIEIEHEQIIALGLYTAKTRTGAGETMPAQYRRHDRLERPAHVTAPYR
jgi:hypothetical protein